MERLIPRVTLARHALTGAEHRIYLNDTLLYLTAAQAGLAVLAPNLISLERIHTLAANGRWVVI